LITIYEKPTCSTCRNLGMLLKERGVEFEKINYIIEGLTRPELERLRALLGVPARALLRTREPEYRELGLDADVSDDVILDALEAHPSLLQRPIVVNGDRAVIARPPERVLEIL
jgi:arsenate reductase